MFKALVGFWKRMRERDPVLSCSAYRRQGCAHVDGPMCDMKTCSILKSFLGEKK